MTCRLLRRRAARFASARPAVGDVALDGRRGRIGQARAAAPATAFCKPARHRVYAIGSEPVPQAAFSRHLDESLYQPAAGAAAASRRCQCGTAVPRMAMRTLCQP
jgi:hypothetical protein